MQNIGILKINEQAKKIRSLRKIFEKEIKCFTKEETVFRKTSQKTKLKIKLLNKASLCH